MELRVYASEHFERGIFWYIIFAVVLVFIFALSIHYKNYIGLGIMVLLFGGYVYFFLEHNKETTIRIDDEAITIADKKMSWLNIVGYILEMDINTKELKNIVFVFPKGHVIYTINDSDKNLEKFVEVLNQYKPLLEDYHQSFFERLIRKLKL